MAKKKPNIHTVSRIQPTADEVDALRVAVNKDAPPLVVAILGVALVEYELERLLRTRFDRDDNETWEMLTGENGPLADFSAKIKVGYALRLYDHEILHSLEAIRRIRNAFAHTKRLLDFDDAAVREVFSKLELPSERSISYSVLERIKAGGGDNQLAYMVLCGFLQIRLLQRHNRILKARNHRRAKDNNPFRTPLFFTPDDGTTRESLPGLVQQFKDHGDKPTD